MRKHQIVSAIAAALCTVTLVAGPATASTAPTQPVGSARAACTPGAQQTKAIHKEGGGGYTSQDGFLASIDSYVTFAYDGCDVTVLHESFTSDVTGNGRWLGYQPVDSRDVVEVVTSPQDTRWARVTHSTTYYSVVTGKTFEASFVFTLQGTGVWAVKYRPDLSS